MLDIFYNEKGYLELLQNILNEGYYKCNLNDRTIFLRYRYGLNYQ